MAGTTWPNLVAGTPARAADVEAKFDWLEGNLDPMLAGTKADATYDLGTSSFRWRDLWISRDVVIAATGKLRIDGSSSGDTYITESGANVMDFHQGGSLGFRLNPTFVVVTGSRDLSIQATQKFYLDNGANTYIAETAADTMAFYTAGVRAVEIDPNGDVGINLGEATSADSKLDIKSATRTTPVSSAIALISSAGGTSEFLGITFAQNNVSNRAKAGIMAVSELANGNASALAFFTRNSDDATAIATTDERMRIDSLGNVVVNRAAVTTSATDGFLYIVSCAGKPTGTPTTHTGRVPTVVDTSNNIPYFYASGAWRPMGQIIGIAAKAVTSTVAITTQTALTIGGQGRLKKLQLFRHAGSSGDPNVGIYLDGVQMLNSLVTMNTAPSSSFVIQNDSIHTGATYPFFIITAGTISSLAFTTSSLLDAFFKSSMTVYFMAGTNGAGAANGTITAIIEYEIS